MPNYLFFFVHVQQEQSMSLILIWKWCSQIFTIFLNMIHRLHVISIYIVFVSFLTCSIPMWKRKADICRVLFTFFYVFFSCVHMCSPNTSKQYAWRPIRELKYTKKYSSFLSWFYNAFGIQSTIFFVSDVYVPGMTKLNQLNVRWCVYFW